MRYPLAFGLMTAMIASGLLIGYAVDHQKQSHTKWQRQKREAEIASFRFEGPAVPGPVPTLDGQKTGDSLAAAGCGIESHHSLTDSKVPANIFKQVGWQRQSKEDGSGRLIVISSEAARRELMSPNRFASPDTSVRLTQSEFASTLWSCGKENTSEAMFLSGLRRAAQVSTESVKGQPLKESPVAASAEQQTVVQQTAKSVLPTGTAQLAAAKSRWSMAVSAFSPSLNAKVALPSDATQKAGLDALAIAKAEFKPVVPIKPSPKFSYTDFITQRSQAISNDLMEAVQLIRNSVPQQNLYSGCGSASAAAELAAQASSDRLEFEILSSVCEINHLEPKSIQFDPFTQVETPVPNLKPWLTSGLNAIANAIAEESEIAANRTEGLLFDAVGVQEMVSSQLYQNAESLAKSAVESSERWWQAKSIEQEELILQPVAAANNLGIRALASKVYNWFGEGNDRLIHRTANVGRTLQQWGVQQNRAVERMVLQHKDTTQR